MIVWLNGSWLPSAEAHISVDDRGWLQADGVFETGLLYRGRYFRLAEHLERLQESARMLGLSAPPAAELREVADELPRRNGVSDASLRITVTRGTSAGPTRLATLTPLAADRAAAAARGWSIITARTRRPSIASMPAQLKALGRTYALLARQEARAAGADDALLLDDAGHVCEGPSWNVFWRQGNRLFTPTLETGVLAGVTRSVLLEVASSHGLEPVVGRFPRAHLDGAEEIFATMTSVGIVCFNRLDGRPLPEARPTAERLRTAYWQVVADETAGGE